MIIIKTSIDKGMVKLYMMPLILKAIRVQLHLKRKRTQKKRERVNLNLVKRQQKK